MGTTGRYFFPGFLVWDMSAGGPSLEFDRVGANLPGPFLPQIMQSLIISGASRTVAVVISSPFTGCKNVLQWNHLLFDLKLYCSAFFFIFLRIALKRAVFALGFKKRFVILLLRSFEKSCLFQKLFVTHSSVGNRVQVRTRS